MTNSRRINTLQAGAPKICNALGRFLDQAQFEQLEADYQRCAELGGNTEPGLVREEGVSFNPRLARVLSLLVTDGGVRDAGTLRAVLYAAALAVISGAGLSVPPELVRVVTAVEETSPSLPEAALIRGVIELDTIRHVHQLKCPVAERGAMLAEKEKFLQSGFLTLLPTWLRVKLEHALTLQLRNVAEQQSR
jgi:hypothetical protein